MINSIKNKSVKIAIMHIAMLSALIVCPAILMGIAYWLEVGDDLFMNLMTAYSMLAVWFFVLLPYFCVFFSNITFNNKGYYVVVLMPLAILGACFICRGEINSLLYKNRWINFVWCLLWSSVGLIWAIVKKRKSAPEEVIKSKLWWFRIYSILVALIFLLILFAFFLEFGVSYPLITRCVYIVVAIAISFFGTRWAFIRKKNRYLYCLLFPLACVFAWESLWYIKIVAMVPHGILTAAPLLIFPAFMLVCFTVAACVGLKKRDKKKSNAKGNGNAENETDKLTQVD